MSLQLCHILKVVPVQRKSVVVILVNGFITVFTPVCNPSGDFLIVGIHEQVSISLTRISWMGT